VGFVGRVNDAHRVFGSILESRLVARVLAQGGAGEAPRHGGARAARHGGRHQPGPRGHRGLHPLHGRDPRPGAEPRSAGGPPAQAAAGGFQRRAGEAELQRRVGPAGPGAAGGGAPGPGLGRQLQRLGAGDGLEARQEEPSALHQRPGGPHQGVHRHQRRQLLVQIGLQEGAQPVQVGRQLPAVGLHGQRAARGGLQHPEEHDPQPAARG